MEPSPISPPFRASARIASSVLQRVWPSISSRGASCVNTTGFVGAAMGLPAANTPSQPTVVFARDVTLRACESPARLRITNAESPSRQLRIAPGLTLNLGKGGLSVSIGPRGAKQTVSTRGNRTTIGVPGTGLSYTVFNPSSKALTATTSTWPSMGFLQGVIASFAELALTARDDVRIRRAVELGVGIERMTRRFTPLCCTTVG